ncbi:MAG: hypothetical protein MMC23_005580 [Stictis urceolatum]|nr:hypothetical protein [Stictis urceolata]
MGLSEKEGLGSGHITVDVRSISPSPTDSSCSDREEKDALPYSSDRFEPSPPRQSPREKLLDFCYIFLNTFSTVAIVFLNKIVFSDPQLRSCQISVAVWHFTATFLILYLSTYRPLSLFTPIRLPLASMLPLSAFFAGFLLLGNLSLAWNPIGFYQLARVLNTPAVVLLGFLLFRRTTSRATMASIAAVCVGVSFTNSQLAFSNPPGTAVALAAVLVTAMYQLWIGGKIEQLKCSAPQLLLNQAPVSVALMACLVPFVDVMPDFALIPSKALWAVAASGILAAVLNLSQFQVIARTSALTFNIVSNLKTIIIVALAWYQDGRVLSLQDVVGVSLAIGGAYAYSQIRQKKRRE